MGEWKVTLPDGKSYKLTAPDEASAAEAMHTFMDAGQEHYDSTQGTPTASPAGPAPQPAEAPAYMNPMGEPDMAAIANSQAPAPQMPYGEQMGHVGHFIDSTARAAADVGSFGQADKLAAAGRAITSPVTYADALQQERARTEEAKKETGPIGTAAGLATGLGEAGLMAKGGLSILPRLKDAPLLAKALGFGAEGGLYGAAQKVGHVDSNDVNDYGNAAREGFGEGAAIGAAVPIIGKTAGAIYQAAAPFVKPAVAGLSRGASGILETATRGGQAALRRLSELGDQAMLADAGPSMTGVAQGVATRPGEGKNALVEALAARNEGRVPRLQQDVEANLGADQSPVQVQNDIEATKQAVTGPSNALGEQATLNPGNIGERPAVASALSKAGDAAANEGRPLPTIVRDEAGNIVPNNAAEQFQEGSRGRMTQAVDDLLGQGGQLETADKIIQRRAEEAAPWYKRGFARSIDYSTPEGQALLDLERRLPAGAKASAANILKMSDEGGKQLIYKVNDKGEYELATAPNARQWDYIKRGLDNYVESQTDQFGRLNTEGHAANGLRKELLNNLNAVNPELARAREIHSSGSDLLDALRLGEKSAAPSYTSERVAADIKDMTEGEKALYRLGHGNALKERLANASDNAEMPHVLAGNEAKRGKLEILAPNQSRTSPSGQKLLVSPTPGPSPMDKFNQAIADENKTFTQAVAPNARAWKAAHDILAERASKATGPEGAALAKARDDLRGVLEQSPAFKHALEQSDYYDKLSSALNQGKKVLSAGEDAIRPEDLADAYAKMSPGERAALYKGVRADVGRRVGTQANDLAALKRAVGGEADWNRGKMGTVFGEEPTQNLIKAVEREQHFANTHNDVSRGSQTAGRMIGNEMVSEAAPWRFPLEAGAVGLIGRGTQLLGRTLLRHGAARSGEAVRNELANVLTLQGPERDAVVQALLGAGARRTAGRQAIEGTITNPALADALAAANARRDRANR